MSDEADALPGRGNRYRSLTELGASYGLSARAVGQMLTAAGLRDAGSGDPVEAALDDGTAIRCGLSNGSVYFYRWSEPKTKGLFQDHKPVSPTSLQADVMRKALNRARKAKSLAEAHGVVGQTWEEVPSNLRAGVTKAGYGLALCQRKLADLWARRQQAEQPSGPKPNRVTFPAGTVLVLTLEAMDVREYNGKHGPFERQILTFDIRDIEFIPDMDQCSSEALDQFATLIGRRIAASVPATLYAGGRFHEFACALLGQHIEAGQRLDTTELIGSSCRGVVGRQEARHFVETALPL